MEHASCSRCLFYTRVFFRLVICEILLCLLNVLQINCHLRTYTNWMIFFCPIVYCSISISTIKACHKHCLSSSKLNSFYYMYDMHILLKIKFNSVCFYILRVLFIHIYDAKNILYISKFEYYDCVDF